MEEKAIWLKPTYEKFTILGLVQTFTDILPVLVLDLLCLEPKASSSASRCICARTTVNLVKKPVYFPICVHSDLDAWGLDIITDGLLHQLYHFPLRNNIKNRCWYILYFKILEAVRITQ